MRAETVAVGGSENLEAMREAVNYNAFLVAQISKRLEGCRRILDFGAGNGHFAFALRDRGFDLCCVEPEPALRMAMVRSGLPCVAELSAMLPGSVDGAYSLNVLEHIDDDQAALEMLFDCLSPGGRLYVYVPAFQILYSAMDRRVGHLRRYRLGQLRERCRGAGFEVEAGAYADSLGFVASIVLRLLGPKDGALDPRSVRIFDRYVFPLSRILDGICRPYFGKNVWLQLRRPQAQS